MNVVFRIRSNPSLEKQFSNEATAQGMVYIHFINHIFIL